MILGKYNQAKTITFDLVAPDGVDLIINATFAAGDVVIMKDEGAEANTTNLPTDEGTGYSLVLTATEMTAARIRLYIIDQTATKIWLDISLGLESYGNASAEHAFDLDTANVTLAAVTHTGAVVPTVSTLTGHTPQTGDNFARLGSPAGASVSADVAAVKSDTAAILIDTSTTLDTKINNIQGATFDTLTDSLESIRDRGDAAWITGAGGSAPTVVQIRQEMDTNSTQFQAIVIDTGTDLPAQISALNDFDPVLDPVASVTLVDTCTANTDMRGTDGSNTVAPDNTSIAAILIDTNELQIDWTNGGRLDLLLDQLINQIDTAASEPAQGAPPVSAKMALKIDYLYKWSRNRSTSTATNINMYADDAATVDHKSTHSDDGTTYDKGEIVTGP